jgi:type IV pilus assembly protein PilV
MVKGLSIRCVRGSDRVFSAGFSLIEVLVTIVILSIGLIGLTGLQARLHIVEMESYQRSQGLLLLQDMVNRISLNRGAAASYVASLSADSCPTDVSSVARRDLAEWCAALRGDSEKISGASVGALIGGRGCIEASGSGYRVTVAWQGLAALSAPPASLTCGQGQYKDSSNATCEACRRVVTTVVQVGTLAL